MKRFLLFLILVFGLSSPLQAGRHCGDHWSEITIRGQIVRLRPPLAVIETPQGETYFVRLGPYRFWRTQGYKLKVGDKVKIRGFRCGEMLFPKVIRWRGGQIRLRDESGVPRWKKPLAPRRFWPWW